MKSHLRRIPLILLCLAPASAEPPGIDQSLEFVVPPSGVKFIRWHGKPGRSYFIQISDPADHLKTWAYAPVYEFGTDIDISHEVDGTAEKGFFRLLYLDDPAVTTLDDVEFASFDGQGMPAEWKVMNGLNPFDGTGINGPNGDLDGDGISNQYDSRPNKASVGAMSITITTPVNGSSIN
jgi:hypothetical protein